jgi:hypothetical protein
LARLKSIGLELSRNDRRIVVMSQFISALGPVTSPEIVVQALSSYQAKLEEVADTALDPDDMLIKSKPIEEAKQPLQQTFWSEFPPEPK